MNLIFIINQAKIKGKVPIDIILKKKNKIINREKVDSADKSLESLDKILKKSKIGINIVKIIKVEDLNKSRYTSYRIIKSIEKALKLGLDLKSS